MLEEGGGIHWYGNAAPKDVPVVLIIPGWTGFKEEMYTAYATQLID
ncbi:hypothetical protein [Paenibacillus sp. IHBB 3054]